MKLAITSVSGKLGSAIARQLISQIGKESVIGIARTPSKAEHLGIEIREGDYNNRAHFDKALQDIDTILLISGMDDPQKRIQQHRNVINAAVQNGVRKIVYTSIVGDENKSGFKPIVQSNRQTEKDVQESGLQWVIGRNGIYIEPDLEYIESYVKDGEIRNSAADGKCAYTSRFELSHAYSKMLLEAKHNGQIYNLVGAAITQSELALIINQVYGTDLRYTSMTLEEYKKERQAALGEFIGTVISGIYEGIRNGANDVPSDFKKAIGRLHKSTIEMIKEIANH